MKNGKKFLTVICFVFFSLVVNAQLRFQKTIGGTILDWANAIEQTPDSGYIILGSTKNFGAGMQDIYLIKVNSFGDTMWTRTLGGLNDEEGALVRITSEGGYIIAGTTMSFGQGAGDIYIVKTDETGNVSWSKTYGGPNLDYCTGLEQCADGGYIISGYSSSFGAGGSDAYLIKTDATGILQWTKTIGAIGHDLGFSARQTNDEGFVMTGCTAIGGSNDLLLVKTDSAGTVSWTKTFGGSMNDVGFSVIQTSDSGYCIAGSTESFGAGDTDIYLVKTDANGDTLWSKTYGGIATEECFAVHQNSDGGYILTGYTNSFGVGGYDMLIIRTDASGQVLWTRTIGGISNAREEGRAVTATIDGGYIVAGYTQSFGGPGQGTDIFIVKTDSLGESGCNHVTLSINYQAVTSAQATVSLSTDTGTIETAVATMPGFGTGVINNVCTSASIAQLNSSNYQVAIFPDPFSTSAQVTVSGKGLSGKLYFRLYDGEGREANNLLINASMQSGNAISFELKRNQLTSGLYFYRLITDSGAILGSGKLVIE